MDAHHEASQVVDSEVRVSTRVGCPDRDQAVVRRERDVGVALVALVLVVVEEHVGRAVPRDLEDRGGVVIDHDPPVGTAAEEFEGVLVLLWPRELDYPPGRRVQQAPGEIIDCACGPVGTAMTSIRYVLLPPATAVAPAPTVMPATTVRRASNKERRRMTVPSLINALPRVTA